jgi:hypothetical protein
MQREGFRLWRSASLILIAYKSVNCVARGWRHLRLDIRALRPCAERGRLGVSPIVRAGCEG